LECADLIVITDYYFYNCRRSALKKEGCIPIIIFLEDLKAAQKEGLSIYAMLSALCSMLYGNGTG